jgi:protein required for attachment to host cells
MKQVQQTHNRAVQRGLPQGGGEHWIIVADRKKAHLYKKTPKGLDRIADTAACCSQPFPEDSAGREERFLKDLAEWLDAAERENAFHRLVLIAPAATTEEIRGLLCKNVSARVCDALARDLEQVTEDEIEDHLAEVMWH